VQQRDLTEVIDAWSAAVADLAKTAPPEMRHQLTKATGDLLEAFASTATNLASHAVVDVLLKLKAQDERIDALEMELEQREREA
jgi:CO/xanthine dehydrogenase Mo-binding subunit